MRTSSMPHAGIKSWKSLEVQLTHRYSNAPAEPMTETCCEQSPCSLSPHMDAPCAFPTELQQMMRHNADGTVAAIHGSTGR